MSALLAVAERELRERWAVLPAALAAGLVALAAPLVPWLPRGSFRDQCGVMALVLATALAGGIALAFGASMITRDLRERRLGFYLAKPIGSAALWLGKVAGGWVLVLGAGALALLPAVLAGALPGALLRRDQLALVTGAAAAAVLGLLLLAHATAVAARARSPLVVLDAALLVGIAAAVAATALRLARAMAGDGVQRGLLAFAALALVALLAAGWVQLAVGRIDARRGHRALSLVIWSVLGGSAGLFALYGWWFLAVNPRDLRGVFPLEAAPRGPWLAVEGAAPGRGSFRPVFLLDAISGRSVRLPASVMRMPEVAFSADGSRAAWLSRVGLGRPMDAEVERLDLAEPGARPVGTTISPSSSAGYLTELTLSADGRRLAANDGRMLSVYEVASGKQLVSLLRPASVVVCRMFFLAPDRLRIVGLPEYAHNVDRADLSIFELDVASRRLRETGRVPDVARTALFFLGDASGPRLLVRDRRGETSAFALVDASTGAPLATLAACGPGQSCQATMLADGRLVVGEAGPDGARLRVFSREGVPERIVTLPRARSIRLGLEPAAGMLLVALLPDRLADPAESTTLIVDLARDTSTLLGRGYRPAGWWWWFSRPPCAPGSVASRLLIDANGALVLLDPSTRRTQTVLAGR